MHFKRINFEKKYISLKLQLTLRNQPEAQFQGSREAINNDSNWQHRQYKDSKWQ